MAHAVLKLNLRQAGGEEHQFSYFQISRRNLQLAVASVGDWVVVYRPRRIQPREASGFYIGTARVERLEPSFGSTLHHAVVDNYTPFVTPVPAFSREAAFERGVVGRNWRSVIQRSVRALSDDQFAAILEAGTESLASPTELQAGFAEQQAEFVRERRESMVSRLARQSRLRARVIAAYNSRCCITGLSLSDGSGNLEAEVSHWQPVWTGGADDLGNVSLVCRTIHWMIERGQISLGDDFRIIAKPAHEPFLRRINATGFARVPDDSKKHPSPNFLEYHRRQIFGMS